MSKNAGIICYGTMDDRQRLAAIVKMEGGSGSAWLLNQIRSQYQVLFGDMDPELALASAVR